MPRPLRPVTGVYAAHVVAPDAPPRLSIVIPAFNEETRIGACLQSLAHQAIDASYEVVLVDNNSTDATVRVAREAAANLQLRIVHESRQGRGPARRAGFEHASGVLVFSADADAIYPPNWLKTLLDALADGHAVAAATTARIDDLDPWRNLVFNVAQPAAMWCYRAARGHHCLSGFSFVVQREVYQASGGFDSDLNANEDDDLSRKVARLGRIRLVMAPVTFSGRRFKHGLRRGLLEYVQMVWQFRSGRSSATLSDIR
jgi:glycosyltransferase involved in cell wall biosynthesis